MINCECCGKKIKKTMYNHIFCKQCAEKHKQKYSSLMNKNSRLKKENDALKEKVGMYE